MKILKPGKVELRKFTCERCGCVFLASKSEINTDIDLYECPQEGCHYYAMAWEDGEPYEEPVQDDRERLIELFNEGKDRTNFIDYLIDSGVTFREV